MREWKAWNVKASSYARNTFNPIRNIVENLEIKPHPDKPLIALSIGDPTVFGNLRPAQETKDSVIDAIQNDKFNGYAPSTGHMEARKAVANYISTPDAPLEAKDVILCSGCSCALDLVIMAVASPGQNIVVSKPGFPLYQTLAEGIGVSAKHFRILPERNWEVDLDSLEEAIDEATAAIVITNPSNPCGSVWSRDHLVEILRVAERNKVVIIADEIYYNFVFEGQEFHWLASLTESVPVLSCGGLTKRFLIPGWRLGWIAIHDKTGVLADVRQGLHSLSQRIIGSNTLIQGALPAILERTPDRFFADTIKVVQNNARLSYDMLNNCKGLHPVMPQGAMYMMSYSSPKFVNEFTKDKFREPGLLGKVKVKMECFPEFESDLSFVENLISEESVFCLPGQCFNGPNFFRVVLTVPEDKLMAACERIRVFCECHYKPAAHDRPFKLTNGVHPPSKSWMHNGQENSEDADMEESTPTAYFNKAKTAKLKCDVTAGDLNEAVLKHDVITVELDEVGKV